MTAARIIRTEILNRDEEEFRQYLKDNGFSKVEIFQSKVHSNLNIYFDNPAEVMTYTLRGIEQKFMAKRSHVYYYDLEEPFDDLGDIFGDEDNRH